MITIYTPKMFEIIEHNLTTAKFAKTSKMADRRIDYEQLGKRGSSEIQKFGGIFVFSFIFSKSETENGLGQTFLI